MAVIDLQNTSGLPLKYDEEKGLLLAGDSLITIQPDIRISNQMTPVLSSEGEKPKEFYRMFRGLGLAQDMGTLALLNLRYDITVIPAIKIGQRIDNGEMVLEFNKTLGHSHAFPEIYEVLHGEAIYLIEDSLNGRAFSVRAQAGDKVLIPSFTGHVTINPGDSTLIMSNWISTKTTSEYHGYSEKAGAMFFYVKDGNESRWIVNPKCKNHVRQSAPSGEIPITEFNNLRKGVPMYLTSKETGFNNLSFLQEIVRGD